MTEKPRTTAKTIKRILDEARSRLIDSFSDACLKPTNDMWRALPRTDLGATTLERAPAVYRFEYRYPHPSIAVRHEYLLEQLRDWIYAYCAGQEFMRTEDRTLVGVALDCWIAAKKSDSEAALSKKVAASISGRKQKRTVDPKEVADRMRAGQSIKAIAADLNVTYEAVRKKAPPKKQRS